MRPRLLSPRVEDYIAYPLYRLGIIIELHPIIALQLMGSPPPLKLADFVNQNL